MLRIVFRSYGGENLKGRPAYYSKTLAFVSFERALEYARTRLPAANTVPRIDGASVSASGLTCGLSVTFANDGPVSDELLERMRGLGEVVQTPQGPVGAKASYVFALELPAAMGWADDDVVVYIEDDYLLAKEALVELARAVDAIPEAGYFALAHGRPDDLSDPEQISRYGTVPWWRPASDRMVHGSRWINILGVTSTFAARVGVLAQDRDIFLLCQRPFRNRWYDHETAMLYQGVRPYRGRSYWTGGPGDFEPTLRGVLRAMYLLPFRVMANVRARRQPVPHLLYAPSPVLAVHLEIEGIDEPVRWEREAYAVVTWAHERSAADRRKESPHEVA